MSREIKFKAWDKKSKIMFYSYDNFLKLEGDLWSLWEMPIGKDKLRLLTNHINGVLLQFTGLKDKNGVEISEGDIVKFEDHDKKLYYFGVVMHDTFDFSGFFIGELINNTSTASEFYNNYEFKPIHNRNLEVIGNMYKNPALLKDLKGGDLNE